MIFFFFFFSTLHKMAEFESDFAEAGKIRSREKLNEES